jgi:hypothetical protein
MYPLPAAPASDEQFSRQPENPTVKLAAESFVWLIRLATIAYVAGYVSLLWQDEELRMYVLHWTYSTLQHVARLVGGLALASEKKYYSIVDTLH